MLITEWQTRVSGVMTNAPFVLNVDCDMFANNPQVVLHAMCMLLGFPDEVNSAFAQAPQHFHSALKDDPFGNQLVVLQQVCTHASYSSSHINKAITVPVEILFVRD